METKIALIVCGLNVVVCLVSLLKNPSKGWIAGLSGWALSFALVFIIVNA